MKQENVTSTSHRNQSMDLLRILACMGVIIVHASGGVFAQKFVVDRESMEWLFCGIICNLFRWSVPIFVMITGFFFLKPEKELTIKKLYGKYILRLVISLIFWTWFYAVTLHCRYTCFYPFGGQDNNFWYVGMCIGLYISMPVLKAIAADEKLLSYSCWTWLFIRIYLDLGKYVELPIVITDYVFTGYVGYCLWGYYLSVIKLNRCKVRIVYFVGLLSLAATLFLPRLTNGKVRISMEDPAIILTTIALFLFVIKHPIRLSPKFEKVILHLSGMTFGIYMAHTFVIAETFTRIHRFVSNVYLFVPIAIGATFVLSYIIILIIKWIPVLKKWVV